MIFVTVGTHEQPFNRLVRFMDEIKGKGLIKEDVVIQTGYSTYEPVNCTFKRMFPYQDMIRLVNEAHIVITHGGPSSFIMPLQVGKTPIVVPRQKIFGEHVNNHQLIFTRAMKKERGNIIVVENIEDLTHILNNYDEITAGMPMNLFNNNKTFNRKFEKIVQHVLNK